MPESAARKQSAKSLSPRKPDATPGTTMVPARSLSALEVHEIEQAHAVLTRLEVENRELRADHTLLLKFAQLAALQTKALSAVLLELPGGHAIAKETGAASPAIHQLTEREQAWIRENVIAPAEALAQQMLRGSSE
jgi:hypothetical protein